MANIVKNPNIFRKSFTFANKDVTKWFPGHMHKGIIIDYGFSVIILLVFTF